MILRKVLNDDRRTDVRGHDDDRVAEINRTSFVIGQTAVVEHLEQDVEYIRVGFLDLVEQHDRIRFAPHRFGELASFVVTDISRRRSDQP